MLLAMSVQVVLPLEPPAAEVAFELVLRAVGSPMASECGRVVERLAAEGSLADEGTLIVMSTHVPLITVAR